MAIRFTPARRFQDPEERLSYPALQLLASGGSAIVEPESVGTFELNQNDAISAVAALATASLDASLTVANTITLAANGGAATLTEGDSYVLSSVTSLDSVVVCEQANINIYYTAYVETLPDGLGGNFSRVRFIAVNFGTASHDVTMGDVIKFCVFSGVAQDQPQSPNAKLVVAPGFTWLNTDGTLLDPAPAVNVDNMNKTALPVVTVPDHSITKVELRGHDIGILGSLYTGTRVNFAVSGDKTVAVGAAVLIATLTFPTSPFVKVGQIGAAPIFTAYNSTGTTFLVYAINNTFATLTVHTGTVLTLFFYH